MNRVVLGLLAGALILHPRPAAAQSSAPPPYGADPYGGAPYGPPGTPAPGAPQYAGPQYEPPAAAGIHTHDGFFLQINGGLGSLGSEASIGTVSAKASGTGRTYSLSVGGAVAENLVIAGNLWGVAVADPTLETGGVGRTASGGAYVLSGIGVNLTYYLMPANVYFSFVPSVAAIGIDNGLGHGTATTKSGFAFRLAAGKEWWVSDNWGLGLHLQYAHSSNVDEGTSPPTWTTDSWSIGFSATYN